MTAQTAAPAATTRWTRALVTCGIVAGPVFLAVWLVQALTRAGFDPSRHPLSLLSLGELGWVQILNFVVCGLLYLACAVGARRVLRHGPGARWAPLLIGGIGVGLVMAGVFTTDAGGGFPAGAPAGAPEQISWHGILHEVGFLITSVAWIGVCVVLARRFASVKHWGWVAICAAAPVAVVLLVAWPDPNGFSLRLVGATGVEFGLLALVAARLLHGWTRPPLNG